MGKIGTGKVGGGEISIRQIGEAQNRIAKQSRSEIDWAPES
jgi:hypothetical protein